MGPGGSSIGERTCRTSKRPRLADARRRQPLRPSLKRGTTPTAAAASSSFHESNVLGDAVPVAPAAYAPRSRWETGALSMEGDSGSGIARRRSGFGVRFETQPTVVVWSGQESDEDAVDSVTGTRRDTQVAGAGLVSLRDAVRRQRHPAHMTQRAPATGRDTQDVMPRSRTPTSDHKATHHDAHPRVPLVPDGSTLAGSGVDNDGGEGCQSSTQPQKDGRGARGASESDAESLRPPLSVVSDMGELDITIESEFQYEESLLFGYVATDLVCPPRRSREWVGA